MYILKRWKSEIHEIESQNLLKHLAFAELRNLPTNFVFYEYLIVLTGQ